MSNSPKKRSRRAATLADVGRAAGVSAMAVSAVLNGTKTSARISDETRERIQTAALKLRYRPNVAARALVNSQMNTIGMTLVVHEGDLSHYYVEVFNGIIEAAAASGQNTTVFGLQSWECAATRISQSCDGRIDGMIVVAPVLTPESISRLPHHTPLVTLHANATLPGSINLETAEEEGAFEMINHLIGQGHRRILHLSGPRGLIGPERRIRGYQRALEQAGIELPEHYLISTDFNSEGGRQALSEWLEAHSQELFPQAIFCGNDAIAIGCMELLVEMGIRVPEDVSVVGFDDTLSARTVVPQLTTVRQPLRRMGSKAVELLLERIKNYRDGAEDKVFPPVVFPTEVILRASVSRPGQDRKIERLLRPVAVV